MAFGIVNRRRMLQLGLALVGLVVISGVSIRAAWAPSPAIRRVAFLASGTAETAAQQVIELRQGLRELGYVEPETLQFDVRYADGKPERAPDLVAELIELGPDVIVAGAISGAVAARRATTTIPIVFVSVGDPVGLGLVASLGRPGGNATGLSTSNSTLNGKRIELLKETVPSLSRIALLLLLLDTSTASTPGTSADRSMIEATGRSLGVRLMLVPVRGPDDLDDAFETMRSKGADAFMDLGCPMTCANYQRVVDLAARHRLPGIYGFSVFPEAGGLMAYGADNAAMYRRATVYVDKILQGASPADLPVEQPTTFDFVINLRSARELGLTIPTSILQQSTTIIE